VTAPVGEVHVRLDSIQQVTSRHRKDLGDVASLAKSMADVGLINPVTLTPDGRLIAGARRVAAAQMLGWDSIPARHVASLDDASKALHAERDENTQRKAMTPEELVSLGKALEALEHPAAVARKAAGVRAGGRARHGLPPASGPAGPQAEGGIEGVVAAALGTSRTTYRRAKTVVAAAYDDTATPEERLIAQAALADMNTTGKVSGNYDRIRRARDSRLGPPVQTRMGDAAAQRRAMAAAIPALAGICRGLNQIEPINTDITTREAAQWVDGLSDARRTLESLIKRLKEFTNAQA